ALSGNSIESVTMNKQSEINMQHTFSTEIKTGDITHQKSSGRCWMFAGMNVLRKQIMDKCNLKTFELSQNYILFYDKLEKANYFYENILDTLDLETDSRLIAWLLSGPLQDGGQWDMLVNIIDKYGVVPKWIMPETFHSSNTGKMTQLLTRKLRKDAACMRREFRNGKPLIELREEKALMLQDIYTILCRCLGTPPEKFDFEYTDKDDKFTRVADLSPRSFYDKYINIDLSEYVSLINAPTHDKPFERTYTVQRLGNVTGGKNVRYLNVTVDELKAAAAAQLKDGELVWFGCDVGKMLNRDLGIMDTLMYDFEAALGTNVELTKAEQLEYGDSLMTHAMVFTAVNIVDEKTVRWRVENSWGDKSGKDGWFIMSDEWFDKFMYQVVVNKKYLTDAQKEALKLEPIELKPWDPMGSLAL
ncbi:MAG: C1 family peptidase, partial [Clostridia bacterium]|nr:C1 family peptidase [Clostridia bacterium]